MAHGGSGLDRALRENRSAVDDFAATSAALPPSDWLRPIAPGRWTPAQIAEHVVLTYEVAARARAGGEPLRPRVGPLFQRVLRWVLLPHILFHRSFPVRAVAPREVRPSEGIDQAAVGARLAEAMARAERAFVGEGRDVMDHPYFGPLGGARLLRLAAVHTEHHRRQLEGLARSRP